MVFAATIINHPPLLPHQPTNQPSYPSLRFITSHPSQSHPFPALDRSSTTNTFFMGSDLDRQIQTLLQCKIITEAEVKDLCLKAREILVEESNVQRVDAPVTVRFPSYPSLSLFIAVFLFTHCNPFVIISCFFR